MSPPPASEQPRVVTLRAAGTALVLDVAGPDLPRVLHWGADLPDGADDGPDGPLGLLAAGAPPVPHSALDEPWTLTLLPSEADGWSGTPGVEVHRAGCGAPPRWVTVEQPVVVRDATGGGTVTARAEDAALGARVEVVLALDAHGVVVVSTTLTDLADARDAPDPTATTGRAPLDVLAVRTLLPLPGQATDVLDLTGRWTRERAPQRRPLLHGAHRRTGRRGRTGHDAPLLLCAGTPGFGFGAGEVWAAHLAWSGDHEHLVERLPEGAGRHAAVLGAGELLRPGEVRLPAGGSYRAPDVVLAWSGEGLDGLSDRLHRRLRARPGHPRSPRPVVLNTWEAVYFDHDLDRLRALADTAAAVGVERFVLDDGWFLGRRDDRRGLGDWQVDPGVWPDGLHPLVDHVRSLGLQVGLWVEPEMVNLDSEQVRSHPERVLGRRGRPPRSWRHQHVLDLTDRSAWQEVLDRLDALVTEYRLDYLKWDHNRDLHEAVVPGPDGPAPGVRAQTLAAYALLDELRRRHPHLEVESCASGGARVDLGVIERTDRVWASDCNDPVERQLVQRWTQLLLPPELVGTHVGPATAHTTGRTTDLGVRLVTALFGHAGLEWDLTACTGEELDAVAAWVRLHRELRSLLHTGRVVRADPPHGPPAADGRDDDPEVLHGVVAPDRSEAALAWVRLTTGRDAVPGARRLPWLDPGLRYRVRVRTEVGVARAVQTRPPGWWDAACAGGLLVSGSVLVHAGLAMPVLGPAQAVVLHLVAERA
ncbi:alpha-galactosidase [Thalassiella azotivora]